MKEIPATLDELKTMIEPLLWDSTLDWNYYYGLLNKPDRSSQEQKQLYSLYIKLLNYNNWYTLIKRFGVDYLKEEVLVDDVIDGLFPRQLRKKYRYVRRFL